MDWRGEAGNGWQNLTALMYLCIKLISNEGKYEQVLLYRVLL